ncbi:hypothetical protein [Oceanicoccus sp. KOV_DT_Chl]|uniref:hypothetical protein n=1 Tax=Oceanicoccus sp. KOV_DT_Chl TaxID=1904639 RepID=UPI000C7C3FE1|nr:hypothetical protein [Oceanicoccus sp. KOV_DT_Chl]
MVRALVYSDVPGHDYLVENILGKKMDGFVNKLKKGQENGLFRNDIPAKHIWLMCASIAMMQWCFVPSSDRCWVMMRKLSCKLYRKQQAK